MKRIIPIALLLVLVNLAVAQQKYYAFNFNGKYGITDTLGIEAMKPSYKYVTIIPAKNQIYLQDFSDKSDIIFNAKTGAKILYERIYDNKVQVKNVSYSMIRNKGKSFLLSEKTEKTIPINRDYDDFKTVGQYIIATYTQQDPFVSGGKDKNGIPLPPKIRELKKYHVFLSNDESLKTIVDKGFDTYLSLYKTPEEKKEDGIVRAETITFQAKSTNPNFDYIILSKGNSHRLFNDKMVLVKAFVLKDADEEMLLQFCEKTLKINLDSSHSSGYGTIMSAPPMAMDNGSHKNSGQKVSEKKPFVPFLYLKELDNGNKIFALQETEEISKRIFEVKSTSKVKLFEKDNLITVSVPGKEQSDFKYNPKTGAIYLPKAYLALLGITLI